MPMHVILAGFALSLVATIFACGAIMRSKHAGPGLWWLIGALAAALVGVFLFAARFHVYAVFTIVLANECLFAAFVLIHHAVISILESHRRYLLCSFLLLAGNFLALSWFTFAMPNVRARILARTTAILIQIVATGIALFRHKAPALGGPIRILLWILAGFGLLQTARLVASSLTTPCANPFQPDPVQAFFSLFTYMFGLGICFAVIWLSLCARRHSLQIMADTDALSGLLNRRAFDEILERELGSGERRARPVTLLLIDLDHFKLVNDRFGHQAGDEVIRRVSQLLWANTRAVDAVARFGGDEFAMILNGIGADQAESIAERLRMQIEALAGFPAPIRVTASIGIAMKNAGDTVVSLVRRSDEALYLSKREGRNRVSAHCAYAEC